MQPNPERARLISEVSGARNEHSMRQLLALIDIIVAETRVDNDRAGVRGVFRNQGKIEGLRQLKDYIMGKGTPTANIFT